MNCSRYFSVFASSFQEDEAIMVEEYYKLDNGSIADGGFYYLHNIRDFIGWYSIVGIREQDRAIGEYSPIIMRYYR